MPETNKKANKSANIKTLTIHNKISPLFSSVHVDGAYGGITPRGLINLNFYSERFPIPKSSDFTFDVENETLSKIKDSDDSKNGIIREYEMGIYMKIDAAKNLAKFLNNKIAEYESQKEKD